MISSQVSEWPLQLHGRHLFWLLRKYPLAHTFTTERCSKSKPLGAAGQTIPERMMEKRRQRHGRALVADMSVCKSSGALLPLCLSLSRLSGSLSGTQAALSLAPLHPLVSLFHWSDLQMRCLRQPSPKSCKLCVLPPLPPRLPPTPLSVDLPLPRA